MKRRSKADLPRLMIKDALKLLTNPQFCEAVKKTHEEAAAIRAAGVATGEAQGGLIELGERFRVTWGVLPPPAVLLVDPDPRRRVVEAIGSGRWGLILVFPWTTDAEIQAQSKNIRKVVRKRHRDAQEDHRAQCAEWLEGSGYSRPQVAKAVWGRDRGLRRPTTAEVIEEVSVDQEREWIEKAMARGLSYEQAAQQYRQHRRKIQGSEAPASAMVRMAEARETARVDKLNEDLATPVTSEPLSAAITRLVQALHDQESDSQVREKARAVHRALIPSASR
jgi:hypothetical protein